MSRGVLLLAVGHPYYGNYAIQLARSINAIDPNIPVAVVQGEGALGHIHPNNYRHFSEIIEIPTEYIYTNSIKDFLKAKTYLYNLSPFDKTIFIDADVIWCPQKPITQLFDLLDGKKFTMSNRGCNDIEKAHDGFIHWAKPKDIMEKYDIKSGYLYNLASEFMYFEKCKEVKKLFKIAQEVFEKPKIEYKRFSFSMPDELAFEIATLKTGLYPHVAPFIPFYWEHFEKKRMVVRDIYDNFYGYSCGGNITEKMCADIYNSLANNANKKYGIKGYFPMKDKKSFLSERSHI